MSLPIAKRVLRGEFFHGELHGDPDGGGASVVSKPVAHLLKHRNAENLRPDRQDALSLGNREHFCKTYLQRALESGFMKRALPDKPNSRNHRHRLTVLKNAPRGRGGTQ